jgi:phage gp16-like protein
LASSVVLIVTPASASRGTDRRRRHHRSIVTNKPSTSAAMRRAARCPTAPHKPLTQVALRAGRSRMLIAVHGLRSGKASETIEDPLNEVV